MPYDNAHMEIREPSTLVDFDAEAALEAGREVAGDALLSCVEYTRNEYNPIYASERVMAKYRDRKHAKEHFSEVMDYCFIDFADSQVFERQLPAAGRVEYFLTRMDHGVVVRLLTESEGLFVFLTPDAPVEETVEAMRTVMHDTDDVTDSPYSTD